MAVLPFLLRNVDRVLGLRFAVGTAGAGQGVTTAGLTDEDRDAVMRLPEGIESNLTGEPGHTGPTGPAQTPLAT